MKTKRPDKKYTVECFQCESKCGNKVQYTLSDVLGFPSDTGWRHYIHCPYANGGPRIYLEEGKNSN